PPSESPVRVRLAVYDAAGRLVRVLVDENQAGGSREAVWNGVDSAGRGVASGIYFSVLEAGKQRRTQKMVLLK
ncbi:MAG TPA: FlgD immunoglobulin-like domain containing protein, partial [Candidatus Krumholzibacteria bacterium]|nr:FlgD immunoglobulin-like domain containing protein [Candidatus Krumholzibacteria bacterium]